MDADTPPTPDGPASNTAPPDPERLAFARELGTILEAAIDRLPRGAGLVFTLRHVQGMSTIEVAEALGVNEAVVKTRLSRARRALRRDLLEHAGLATGSTFRFLGARCDRVVAGVMARIG